MSVVGGNKTVRRYQVLDAQVDRPRSRANEEVRETRYYERDVEVERAPARAWRFAEREAAPPGDLERYVRNTDYYAPQPIIIRENPIIIRNEPAEQQLVVRERDRDRDRDREERRPSPRYEEQRQVARRPSTPEEDWYYERRTRELDRRGRDDYDHDDRDYRRDIRPRDSASQYGGGRGSYSDDEFYYKKETTRGHSPHHKRHLAEGAAVGLGAAALLQHHRKSEGEKTGGAGQLIGGAALGTVGAEIITRVRDHYTRSRSRSVSWERDSRGGRYRAEARSRSRSTGPSGIVKLGAVAALGALAGYAVSRNNKNSAPANDRRSRSRRRRGSVSRNRSLSGSRSPVREAQHKNNVIAGAGLASAAVAGLVEHSRSKSRSGRSRSRVSQGVPIVAAGLGGAAVAGLYEKNKSKSRARSRRRRDRSERPRSRARSDDFAPYAEGYIDANRDRNLIEYGEDPISATRMDHRHRASPSSSESPPRHRRSHKDRSRSRHDRNGAREGSAAHEASRRRERMRVEQNRQRQDLQQEQIEHSNDPYNFGPYAQAPPTAPAVPVAAYPPSSRYMSDPYNPHGNVFPPPPDSSAPAPQQNNFHNPYAAPGSQYDQPAYPSANPFPQYPGEDRYRSNNVSAPSSFYASKQNARDAVIGQESDFSGAAPAIRKTKSVQFDLGRSATSGRRDREEMTDEGSEIQQASYRRSEPNHKQQPQARRRNSTGEGYGAEHAARHRGGSVSPNDSDETIELPARFDSQGRKKTERGDDPLADKIEDMLDGRGFTGRLFRRLAGDLKTAGRR